MNGLIEIGTEEIPAAFLPAGRTALRNAAKTIADDVAVYASPRRLAIYFRNLPARSEDVHETVKGPPLRAAFDAAGKPTKAAEGFAKKIGLTVEELERDKDGEYLRARVLTPGRGIEEILAEAIPKILTGLPWPKSMRWNDSGVRFVRPVRWIVALLDDRVVPITWGGVTAGRETFVRRTSRRTGITIAHADRYLETLRAEGILVDQDERVVAIRTAVEKHQGVVYPAGESTLEYLADHVEDPKILLGEFDPAFADAPREVLELTMWKHQKYLPIADGEKLLPKFILVANRTFGDSSRTFEENVVAGNRRVLSARLSDARYFWTEDLKRPLIDRLTDLDRVLFQKDVGSMRDRVTRIEGKAAAIAPDFNVAEDRAIRAARLCKADLTTKMVFEFPELQGVVGRRIAEAQGENADVARAIEEHYWPVGADPRIPSGLSAVIALAEKADTIESIFSAGLEPTGSADPYALRRAAIGIVRILIEHGRDFDVTRLLNESVRPFVRSRAIHYLAEQSGASVALVEAVASVGWTNLRDFALRSKAAAGLSARPDFGDLATSFKRVMNILDTSEQGSVDERLLEHDAERNLHHRTIELARSVEGRMSAGDVNGALTAIAEIRPLVDKFFDDVLVNVESEDLRRNRKALLGSLGAVFLRIIDFSKI